MKIVLAVWRYTYGFNRKDHEMSLTFLSNAIGAHKQQIKTELDKLIDRNVLKVTSMNSARKSRRLSFNKNYDQWDILESVNSLTVSGSRVSKIIDSRVSDSTDSRVSEITYQEINNLNKNLNKNKEDEENTLNRILELLEKSKIINPEDITEFLRDDIDDVINNFGFEQPEQLIEEAIKDAARGNGKTWKFVYKKLCSWRKKGITTLADLESEDDTSGGSKKYRSSNGRAPKKSSESITGNKVGWIGKRD